MHGEERSMGATGAPAGGLLRDEEQLRSVLAAVPAQVHFVRGRRGQQHLKARTAGAAAGFSRAPTLRWTECALRV